MTDVNQVSEEGLSVKLPSGAEFKVLTPSEVEYVNDRVHQYQRTFKWDNISDVQDVDRIVIMELFVYRWGSFLAMGKDYYDDDVDEQALRKSINDWSGELRLVKKSLGMDKATRDKDSGDDSVPAYLERLRLRAKEFGINRNKMMDKGLVLSQQVIALATLYKNCDQQERLEQRCTAEDVCNWLLEVYIPEFQVVDSDFRKTSQTLWIADQ